MYRKFNNIDNSITRECHCRPSKFSPIVDLGYATAEERINSIMQAGQILQSAKEQQFAYRASEHPSIDFDNNSDICAVMYGDAMDCLDMAKTLGNKVRTAMESATAVKSSQTHEASHSEPVESKPDKDND